METKGINRESAKVVPFEFCLVNDNRLCDFAAFADQYAFADKLAEACPDNPYGGVFMNLSADAHLVCPKFFDQGNKNQYGHLGSFLRQAPTNQIEEMWKLVAETYREQLIAESPSPIWLSTAGGGVRWLHFRFDKRPKYYRYEAFKSDYSLPADRSMDKILEVAQMAALLAGEKILEALSNCRSQVKATKNQNTSLSTDLVTETDQLCEEIVLKVIKDKFPNHLIIGEESSGTDKYALTGAPTWTIDPIDGTTNFVHRLKLSCVIISYLVAKEVRVAVVYDPYADELFWAVKGRGAFLKKGRADNLSSVPIQVSKTKSISKAVISMDPGYGRDSEAVNRFCTLQSAILSRGVRNIRVIGCTGLNMAYVACGRLDAGFEEGCWDKSRGPKIWDFAAGKLLVSEAGGLTRDIERSSLSIHDPPLDLMKRSFFCASTLDLAGEILEVMAQGLSNVQDLVEWYE